MVCVSEDSKQGLRLVVLGLDVTLLYCNCGAVLMSVDSSAERDQEAF